MAVDVLGASIKRVEDHRFITGAGRYLDDIKLPSMAYAAVLRSPYAHANIRSVDTSAAKAMPGVVAVFTGADIPYNPLPFAWPAGGSAGLQNNVNMPRILATDSVKWTGEGVAAVIADSPEQAVDALDAIAVDYEPLPTVVDAEKATQPGAPQLHENAPNNIVFDWTVGDLEGTDKALADAEVVVRQRLVNQRLIPNAMETRGDIGWYNPGNDEYTVWMSSQTPHIQRLLLTAFVTGIPEHKVRCISPDVGGAFGSKIFCYADYGLVMFASKAIGGRPVKWVESRRENYQSTIHGRDHITYVEIAATRDGEVTGLKVKTYANLGGRLSTIGPGIPTTLYGRMLAGPYKIPNVFCEVIGVYTNTVFTDAYRGAGRPEATYVLERSMDLLADELGMDPAEVRRKNFLANDVFPYRNPSGLFKASGGAEVFIDSGNYEPALDRALAMANYDELDAKKAEAKGRGKLLGLGLSTYIEICGVAPSKWIGAVGEGWGAAMWESSNIKVHLTGKIVVTMGTQPQGQGHETTFSQIIAHELGVPMEDIVVQHSDTQGTPFGYGTYGSRTAAVGGTAAVKAAGKIREKAKLMAAHMLEASAEDIEVDGANYSVKGSPDKVKTIQEIAFALDLAFDVPEGMEPYLDETAYYDAPNTTWPFGTHLAIVEVDEETGEVDLVRYIAVDDVGNKINPMIVDGQLHGGIAQGVGQALWETAVYGDDGQLLSGSMLDYALPKASRMPNLELDADGHPVAGQPARGKRCRRGRHDRQHAGDRQRGDRRAVAARHPSSRHAVLGPDGVARDPGREGRPGMIPATFNYVRASSVEEALGLLGSGNSGTKLIAGGHSLLPLLKLRLAAVDTLVDIGRIEELKSAAFMTRGSGYLIRPLTTYADLMTSDVGSHRGRGRRPAHDRRRPSQEPGHHRRRDRPRRSGLGHAGGPARSRCDDRGPIEPGRPVHPDRRVLRRFRSSRPWRPTRSSPRSGFRRSGHSARRTSRWSSRRRATRSSGSPSSRGGVATARARSARLGSASPASGRLPIGRRPSRLRSRPAKTRPPLPSTPSTA